MQAIYLVVALAVAAANAKSTKHVSHVTNVGDTSRPHPWYDCSGKTPGNYMHPDDCTRFIMCDAGLQAIEFDCGECSNRPEACTPQNRLVYNATVDQCLWATDTECATDPTDPPPTETNPPPTETTTPHDDDNSCNPEDCHNKGECQWYWRCDKDTRKWVRDECGDEMFWNPDNGAIHGGNCDHLDNLSDEVRDRYRSDPECLACFWRADGECSASYKYQAPDNRNRDVLDLTCSAGLVFSEEKETCQRCEDVTGADGNACC